jgi:hypothetical protein
MSIISIDSPGSVNGDSTSILCLGQIACGSKPKQNECSGGYEDECFFGVLNDEKYIFPPGTPLPDNKDKIPKACNVPVFNAGTPNADDIIPLTEDEMDTFITNPWNIEISINPTKHLVKPLPTTQPDVFSDRINTKLSIDDYTEKLLPTIIPEKSIDVVSGISSYDPTSKQIETIKYNYQTDKSVFSGLQKGVNAKAVESFSTDIKIQPTSPGVLDLTKKQIPPNMINKQRAVFNPKQAVSGPSTKMLKSNSKSIEIRK